MTELTALIFDLDGTLIDSAPDIAAAVNAYCVEQGWPELSVEYVEQFIGNGPRRLLLDIFVDRGLPSDEAAVTRALRGYLDHYARSPAGRTRFFPHVAEDLRLLRAAGFRMGICTNKTQALTDRVLAILGLDRLFEAVVGADAVPACKPDPGHLRAVARRMGLAPDGPASSDWAYVGDTRVDQATAAAAGVPFFAVPWGGGALVEVEAERRLDRLRDLVAYRSQPVPKRA